MRRAWRFGVPSPRPEFVRQGSARPHLIYLGVENLRVGGRQGYGLLIEQANKIWGLECYMNDNP